MTSSSSIVIHPDDSVCITLRPFAKGEELTISDRSVILQEDIPQGHKIARKRILSGEHVLKFGYSIGKASSDIQEGQWVHTHNLRTNLEGMSDYRYEPAQETKVKVQSNEVTFQGYVRKNGDIGIRNEIWIINTVGCINKTAELLAKMGNEQYNHAKFDGVFHFAHPFGCSQLGDDLRMTQSILSDLVHHPNAAGVLVLGLGCENNYVELFKKSIGEFDPNRVKFLVSQEIEDELEIGMELIGELVGYAEQFEREPVPVSSLKVGLKCGGSDGFSGITANPLVGSFSDVLVSQGGTSIMTEVPEMFGAETILMNRANNEEVFHQTVSLINDFKQYYIKHDQVIYENPSPGNKQGGITTLEEKSLGCVQKGGHAQVMDVLPYGVRVTKNGLNLVEGPGNDLVSVTALAASGAHIVLFTTGRGTPFGGPVPTVKISTNSQLFQRKRNWIDFNAGQLLEDVESEHLTGELFNYVLQVASGEVKTCNERNGFKEIAIFKDGVTL
ncbi:MULTISPECIES: altronate dehydratase family protein [unclassified Paenibacillus]|uniref:UxaA family hydrolase n=1 Tax=unclassified Paenibacillus TaxID=185978 RepID=UPI001AEB7049|nr:MULTISPECIES: altronate dehydratase family protein [unclassified Paenibacillus]MBP1155808.1 altronate hydrolase [Paenibacillus sp. PvP091]MBP1168806.1 altronate hydrolase [Paenibacillus sp. PvR098]MBP2439834.1 altronate hydrolase [Paenibacillus sp. PvP052]